MSHRLYLIRYFHISLLAIFLWSCNSKQGSQSSSSTMDNIGGIEYVISNEMGEMINTIFQDTSQFVGLPGYLGYNEVQNRVCLVFGKSISKDTKIIIRELGSLRYMINDEERNLFVGIPTDEKYQNLAFDEQLSFNIDYNNLKLWIQDWIQNAYAHKHVVFKGWD